MKFSFCGSLDKRDEGDLLILPFWEEGAAFHAAHKEADPVLKTGDFKGKAGENCIVYVSGEKEPRFLLLGLGKEAKINGEALRRAYANAARVAQSKGVKRLNVLMPEVKELKREEVFSGVAEGVLLTNYAFNQLKKDSLKDNPTTLFEKVEWIGVEESPLMMRLQTIAMGVYFVRDLVNGNADDVTPQKLAETAMGLERSFPKLKATVWEKRKLEEEKMGLLLAVGKGSTVDPVLIQLAYKGNPHSEEHIVLVGKGVTYDTGGLNLKLADGMLTMKCDMSGAATVLGTVQTAAALGLKVNVTAVVPSTENSIGPMSFKPGDVYRSYSGKTVEITNTDAEGRLILADALSFAVKNLKPTSIIDLATLTGAIVIALGEEIAGLFSNNDALATELLTASKGTGEMIWRMPLYADYLENYKSDIADLVNSGSREGSSMKAALFLQEFVGSHHWAHLDIAGPAFLSKPKGYYPTKGTGFGLRLLIEYLEKKQ